MTKHPYFDDTTFPRVLAHRGLVTTDAANSGVADNSFAAVAAAHAAGAAYIESDCHLTSDGVVVLFHDESLERITGDKRRVGDVTERELSLLMADRGGLITLAQALDAFPEVRFNLDVKAIEAAVGTGILCAPHAHRVLITSFADQRRTAALHAAEQAGAKMRPATSGDRHTIIDLLFALAVHSSRLAARALNGVDALQIPERQGLLRVLSRRLIAVAHANDVEVHVWTVNDVDDMRRLVDLGVDGIVTDRADAALAAFGQGS